MHSCQWQHCSGSSRRADWSDSRWSTEYKRPSLPRSCASCRYLAAVIEWSWRGLLSACVIGWNVSFRWQGHQRWSWAKVEERPTSVISWARYVPRILWLCKINSDTMVGSWWSSEYIIVVSPRLMARRLKQADTRRYNEHELAQCVRLLQKITILHIVPKLPSASRVDKP